MNQAAEKERDRDRLRNARAHAVKARSLRVGNGKRGVAGAWSLPARQWRTEVVDRPKTRGECASGARPCPYVACVHHLYLDVSAKTGAIKLNFPDLEPSELTESCALDVADRRGETARTVGAVMNLTRERIRQIEQVAMAKCDAVRSVSELIEDFATLPTVKFR